MATTSFENFYSPEYNRQLNELERIRKRIIFNYLFIGFVVMAGFVFEAITWMLIGIAVIILFIFFYIRMFGISKELYQARFFQLVQGKIGKFLLPSGSFDPNRYLPLSLLQKALLVTGEPSQFGGRNLTEDKIGEDHIKIAEINAYTVRKGSGPAQDNIHFKGWAGTRTFPGSSYPTVILTSEPDVDLAENESPMPVPSSGGMTSWYNDEGFYNRQFGPAQLMRIATFRDKWALPVFISINEDTVCVAVSLDQPYSDAGVWKAVNKKTELEKMYAAQQFIRDTLLALPN